VRQLLTLFLEAKWFHNHLLASGDLFNADYRLSNVQVKVKDHYETRAINNLSSQMRQELLDRMKDNIKGLSLLKKNGHKVGRLQFKSTINSIPLKQYGVTWKILDKRHVRIQGVKRPVKIRGLSQIPEVAELVSALLIRKHEDLYLHATTYQPKPAPEPPPNKRPSIGIDLGVKNQITTSSGIRINYEVPITRRLRGLCRQLSRRKVRSRNWNRTRIKLEKEYDRTVNTKHDITNKITHTLTTLHGTTCIQNDNLQAWQRLWGKRMLNTALGEITSALQRKAQTLSEVNRFYPSTKTCSLCGAKNETPLNEHVYHCLNCGLVIDRDLNAAINILREGLRLLGEPTEHRRTPADTRAATELVECLNRIPRVRASLVEETGSPAETWTKEAHDFSRG